MDVYVLDHTNLLPGGEEDVKLIGVYATQEDAERAKQRVVSQPGFRDSPDGFCISDYTLGEDNWTEGFITVTHEQLLRDERLREQNSSN